MKAGYGIRQAFTMPRLYCDLHFAFGDALFQFADYEPLVATWWPLLFTRLKIPVSEMAVNQLF